MNPSRLNRNRTGVRWLWAIPVFVGLWWLLLEGRVSGLWFAVPVMMGVVFVMRMIPDTGSSASVRVLPLLSFFPSFIAGSLVGGLDVAWRVMMPRMPIRPSVYAYDMTIENDTSRAFFAQVISLMPGTLAFDIQGNQLMIHALLDDEGKIRNDLREMEIKVSRIFVVEHADA